MLWIGVKELVSPSRANNAFYFVCFGFKWFNLAHRATERETIARWSKTNGSREVVRFSNCHFQVQTEGWFSIEATGWLLTCQIGRSTRLVCGWDSVGFLEEKTLGAKQLCNVLADKQTKRRYSLNFSFLIWKKGTRSNGRRPLGSHSPLCFVLLLFPSFFYSNRLASIRGNRRNIWRKRNQIEERAGLVDAN